MDGPRSVGGAHERNAQTIVLSCVTSMAWNAGLVASAFHDHCQLLMIVLPLGRRVAFCRLVIL